MPKLAQSPGRWQQLYCNTLLMNQPEKIKISSDFILPKLILFGILGVLFLLLTDYQRTETNILVEYGFIFIVLSFVLYYLFTRPDIYYDNNNLYIIRGTSLNTEIPFENIQSIKFSIIGFGQGSNSYLVKYRDSENQIKSVRIFEPLFSNLVSKFICCVEKKNTKVKVSNASFGINELFD